MTQEQRNQNDGSLEQEKKQQQNKDIEPQRDPVKPQEETAPDK